MRLLKKIQQKISYHIDPILTYTQNQRSPQSSYAQLQEDIVIQALIGSVEKFIDVGAYDGIKYSNTFLFALQGAKGLCFEPVKSTFFKLDRLYLFNPRVECINEGISNEEKTLEIKSYGPLSSIDETKNPRHRECRGEAFAQMLLLLKSEYFGANASPVPLMKTLPAKLSRFVL